MKTLDQREPASRTRRVLNPLFRVAAGVGVYLASLQGATPASAEGLSQVLNSGKKVETDGHAAPKLSSIIRVDTQALNNISPVIRKEVIADVAVNTSGDLSTVSKAPGNSSADGETDAEVANAVPTKAEITKDSIKKKMKFYPLKNGKRVDGEIHPDGVFFERALLDLSDIVYELDAPGLESTFNMTTRQTNTMRKQLSSTGVFVTDIIPLGERFPTGNDDIKLPFVTTVGTADDYPHIVVYGVAGVAEILKETPTNSALLLLNLYYAERFNILRSKIGDSLMAEGKTSRQILDYFGRNPANSLEPAYEAAVDMMRVYDRIKPQFSRVGIQDSDILAQFRKAWGDTDVEGRKALVSNFFFISRN